MKLFGLTILFAVLAYVAADVSHLFNRGNVTPYKGPLPGDLPQNQPRQYYPQQNSYQQNGGQYYQKYQQPAARYNGYSSG